MNWFQTIRIVFLLLLIFIAGVWTGRFSAPKPQFIVVGQRGKVQTAETALARLKARIPLSAEQELKIRRMFEEMEDEVSKHPPFSAERMEIFRRYMPRVRAVLDPAQYEAFDRHVQDVERRFQSFRRRSGSF